MTESDGLKGKDTKPSLRDVWWPNVKTEATARKAISSGVAAGLYYAAMTLLTPMLQIYGGLDSPLGGNGHRSLSTASIEFAIVGILLLVTFALFKKSRIAGLLILLFGILDFATWFIYVMPTSAGVGLPIVRLIFFILAINGARGTIGYHKLKRCGLLASQQISQGVPHNSEK